MLDLLDQAADLAAWMSAIGLALVSGQPADRHANDLRALWEKLRAKAHSIWTPEHAAMRGDAARGMLNRMSASVALAQGVEGIAVGLSCRILPHNFVELCQACITGEYPTKAGQELYQIALKNASSANQGRTYENRPAPVGTT